MATTKPNPEFEALAVSWELSLRADGYSDNTIKAYRQAVAQLARWLAENGSNVGTILGEPAGELGDRLPVRLDGVVAVPVRAERQLPGDRQGLELGVRLGGGHEVCLLWSWPRTPHRVAGPLRVDVRRRLSRRLYQNTRRYARNYAVSMVSLTCENPASRGRGGDGINAA